MEDSMYSHGYVSRVGYVEWREGRLDIRNPEKAEQWCLQTSQMLTDHLCLIQYALHLQSLNPTILIVYSICIYI